MTDSTNTPTETTPGQPAAPRADTPGARLAAKRAAKAARKASQRGTDNPGEEVTRSLLDANDWLAQHKSKLWTAVAVLVLGGGGLIAWSSQQEAKAASVGALLVDAVTTSKGIVSADGDAAEDSLLPTFESANERDAKALEQFRAAASKDPSAAATPWARLGEAGMLLGTGKLEEAERAYAAVADASKGEGDEYLRVRALEGTGYALEAQKKTDAALEKFAAIGGIANGAYKTLGEYHRGRVLAATGKRDEAIKALEAIVKADAAKPTDQQARFETEIASAKTLLEELGVAPEAKPSLDVSSLGGDSGKGEISEQVMDAIRKQLEAQKAGSAQ